MRWSIRSLSAQDLDAVLAIERISFQSPWSREQYREELMNPRSRCWVAVNPAAQGESCPPPCAGGLVGYVCVWMVVDEMHVMNVATHPRWRRLGVARTLMERALAEARGLGIVRAFLEVRASNAAAQGLYNSLGFEPVGVRRSYYEAGGEDALVMAKALRAGHETP